MAANVETCTVDLSQGRMRPGGSEYDAPVYCQTCFRPARYVYSFTRGRGGAPHQQIFCQACADIEPPPIVT
jgi:hypothetical protein